MLKRLEEILAPIGLSKMGYHQMRQRGAVLPVYKVCRPNTKGRGAEYLFEEEEVLKAITEFREKARESKGQAADPSYGSMTMREKIIDILSRHAMRRSELRDLLGAAKGSKAQEFDLMFNDLVAQETIHQPNQFSAPGKYAVKLQSQQDAPPPEEARGL